MPTRRPLRKYPLEYRDLFLSVAKEGMRVIPLPSAKRADLFRRELYNYRVALWEDTVRPETQADHALLQVAESLHFAVEGKNLIIYIYKAPYTQYLKEMSHGT